MTAIRRTVSAPLMRTLRSDQSRWVLLFGAALLAACDAWVPSTIASNPARDCRDQFCEGDLRPSLNPGEAAVKVNNRWYAGPAEYFNGYDSRTSFDWWEHRAVVPKARRPVDMPSSAANGQLQDLAIDIRLTGGSQASGVYWRDLDALRAKGRVLDKRLLRMDLEHWSTKGESGDRNWFVAASLKDPKGAPPTLVCDGPPEKQTICQAELQWGEGLSARLRVRGQHVADWPDIYMQTARILQSLRPV